MNELIIGFDMDEVLADLHRPWNRWINERFGVNRWDEAGFTDWDEPTRLFGTEVYDFLTPTIYSADIVKPIAGALDAVLRIRDAGYFVRIVSSCLNDTYTAKVQWCIRHGFIDAEEEWKFMAMSDKSEAPVNVLIDDHVGNCRAFHSPSKNRIAVLMTKPHNQRSQWNGIRADTLGEVAEMLTILRRLCGIDDPAKLESASGGHCCR